MAFSWAAHVFAAFFAADTCVPSVAPVAVLTHDA
jgi:hypothetical protein